MKNFSTILPRFWKPPACATALFKASQASIYWSLPQHFLYFLPLPQGQGSLRPTFWTRRGCFLTVPSSNPVDAYKRESLHMFEEMVAAIQEDTVRRLYSIRLKTNQEIKRDKVPAPFGIVSGGGQPPAQHLHPLEHRFIYTV